MRKLYCQGDVGLLKLDTLPNGAVRQKVRGDIVLALGEATGHRHRIPAGTANLYEWQGDQLVEVGKRGAILVHEEHSSITLEPGIYKRIIQREYRPEGIRNVTD